MSDNVNLLNLQLQTAWDALAAVQDQLPKWQQAEAATALRILAMLIQAQRT